MVDVELAGEQDELLRAAGLPLHADGIDANAALAAMGRDKKRRLGEAGHRFVLLEDVGRPVWGVPVTDEEVRKVMGEVLV